MSIPRALAAIWIAAAGSLAIAGCRDSAAGRDAAVFDGKFDWPDARVIDAGPGQACLLLCPNPTISGNTICGQLYDFETDQPIVATTPTGVECQDIPVEERTGPCLLDVRAYDAIALFQNPDGAAPQAADSVTVNDCGRFVIQNVHTPSLGFMALVVGEAEGGARDWLRSALVFPVAAGDKLTDQAVYAVATSTDEAWTASAGNPFGATSFAEHGVSASLFRCEDSPVAGVTVINGGVADPAHDYYFSDADPATRSTVDPGMNVTGADGAALLTDASLITDGTPNTTGLPEGCEWSGGVIRSVPGLVTISEWGAFDSDLGDPCDCP